MSATQPIKNIEDIEALKNYFFAVKPNMRNYAMTCLGINSALRIGDLLNLNWQDVYDFSKGRFLKHITTIEKKTGKRTQIALNRNAVEALNIYKESLLDVQPADFLFPGKHKGTALSRCQAFRVLNDAGHELHFEIEISCHTLRKTFGYHACKAGAQPTILMRVFNHSSFQNTKRYLGIDQDEKDEVFLNMNL
ncbi:MAG: tyrosine-type recombinase/integrase [Lachnospiraceae bacterium]|jgi:integrase|nr:tyrosine-type recombinase/integrase [Lachnospiraceae bacterium]